MNKLSSFLRLIRLNNLLIIILTQLVIKFFLINPYLSNSALSTIHFGIYLFALITVVAGGYIINDIYDVEIDKINRPDTRIIDQEISEEHAIKTYYIINIIAIFSSFYVSYQIEHLSFGFIFIFLAFNLWKYSKYYKTRFLIGNIQVAFLTSLSIIILALFDLVPLGITDKNGTKIIFYIILIYTGFSFITTLIREIIKDLEDSKGDKRIGAKTLAIEYGIKKTRRITSLLILIPIIGIGYFQYFQYSILNSQFSVEINYWGVNQSAVLYTLLIQILLATLLVKTGNANTRSDFQFLSKLCKTIMIIGILAIPLFHYLLEI